MYNFKNARQDLLTVAIAGLQWVYGSPIKVFFNRPHPNSREPVRPYCVMGYGPISRWGSDNSFTDTDSLEELTEGEMEFTASFTIIQRPLSTTEIIDGEPHAIDLAWGLMQAFESPQFMAVWRQSNIQYMSENFVEELTNILSNEHMDQAIFDANFSFAHSTSPSPYVPIQQVLINESILGPDFVEISNGQYQINLT